MASAGRLLRWVGALLILASPVILATNPERLGEVARQLALGLLAWAALCLVWSLLTVGLRQWIWWTDRS